MSRLIDQFFSQEKRFLALIVAGGIALRFLAVLYVAHTPYSDELAYRSMALNLISGRGIIDHMGNYAMYNVGYSLFVLSPGFLIAGNNLFLVRILNILLGGIAIILCYGIAKESGAGKLGRVLAAAFWAFYIPANVYAVYLAKENLMIPLMLLVLWFSVRLVRNPSYLMAAGCGISLGFLALTGNSGLVLIFVVALAVFFSKVEFGKKLSLVLLIMVSMLAIASPWVIRNWSVLGSPVLNTNFGFNLYLGNNPSATGEFVSISDTPQGGVWDELRSQSEIVASEALRNEALAWIKENPDKFLGLAWRKAGYFWMPPVHQGESEQSNVEALARTIWAIQFFLLIGAATGTIFCSKLRQNNAVRMMWLAVVGYTTVHMLFYVIVRYREPIMPFLCIMAALAIESVLVKFDSATKGAPMHRSS
jgi:4-amino-4-deoxy-L-arabinose transferase-like glycosyltransferase